MDLPIDSSYYSHPYTTGAHAAKDNTIRVGIVAIERLNESGAIEYVVDLDNGSTSMPVVCMVVSRFGGVHNYEEYNFRPWIKATNREDAPNAAYAGYALRAGDMVLVALIGGNGREGVIIGSMNHPARTDYGKNTNLEVGDASYHSLFNGVKKTIYPDGQYKTIFNGLPTNTTALDKAPDGTVPPAPEFDESIAGSYYGFDGTGSFIMKTSEELFLQIDKEKHIYMSVRDTLVEVTDAAHAIIAGTINRTADKYVIKTTKAEVHESLKISLKGTQIAIGNDQIELIDGLIQLIDALGTSIVTSPVGTCTPLNASPTWASSVVPLQVKLQTLKTSLDSADEYSFNLDVNTTIGTD